MRLFANIRPGYQYLMILTLLLIVGELVFRYLAESEIEESIIKVFLIGLPLVFVYMRYNWAKWAASIVLALNGILSIGGMSELSTPILGLVGLFNIIFAVSLHTSKKIKSLFSNNEGINTVDTDVLANVTVETFDYPYLLTRIQATMIDGGLLASFLAILLLLTPNLENRLIVAIIFCVAAILYEPVFLTLYSATIGHKIMRIKVMNLKHKDRKLNLLQGFIRIFTKYFLGWMSFITINFNPGHRAIHDYFSSSIVIKN